MLARPSLSHFALLLLAGFAAAGCSTSAPCAICYEDEWSREPFPGQPKQHIKPLTPETAPTATPAAVSPLTHEFLGVSAGEDRQPF